MTTTHTIPIDETTDGMRLDKALATVLPEISRARLQALIEQGAVARVGGIARATPALALVAPLVADPYADFFDAPPAPKQSIRSQGKFKKKPDPEVDGALQPHLKVKTGETYVLTMPEVVALGLIPAPIALDVVYEDDAMLVINKPAGMSVHPGAGTDDATLVHALLAHCGDSLSGIGGVARPGIVHRIDKETTGLLVVAKHDAAHQALSAQLESRVMSRRYVAYVWGGLNPRDGTVDAPIARNPRYRQKMAVVEGGRESVTHYETLTQYRCPGTITPLVSKIACALDTGRTHQIRVHMLHIKAPLVGDPVYGISIGTRLNRLKYSDIKIPEALADVLRGFDRQALHAAELSLEHPVTGEAMHFTAPLPADMVALEAALGGLVA